MCHPSARNFPGGIGFGEGGRKQPSGIVDRFLKTDAPPEYINPRLLNVKSRKMAFQINNGGRRF